MRKHTMAVIAAISGVVLAGCGEDGSGGNGVADLGADEILAEAQAAMDAAESARIVGSGTFEGQTMELDLRYGTDSGVGTIAIDGAEFEVTYVDGNIYMNGAAAAWEQAGAGPAASMLADKHARIPADDPAFASMAQLVDLSAMTDEVLVPEGEVTKGEESEIDGRPVVGVVNEEGRALYIATTGEPVPVQMTAPEGEDGTVDFEWDVEVEVTAPDEADVIDMTELQQ